MTTNNNVVTPREEIEVEPEDIHCCIPCNHFSEACGSEAAFTTKSLGILLFEVLLFFVTIHGTTQRWPLTLFVAALILLQVGNIICLVNVSLKSVKFQNRDHG